MRASQPGPSKYGGPWSRVPRTVVERPGIYALIISGITGPCLTPKNASPVVSRSRPLSPPPRLTYREPELFQLAGAPSTLDEATNSVVAGSDRLKLFKGAELALQELSTQERFSGTQVAVASSTSRREWALRCLSLLQVRVLSLIPSVRQQQYVLSYSDRPYTRQVPRGRVLWVAW